MFHSHMMFVRHLGKIVLASCWVCVKSDGRTVAKIGRCYFNLDEQGVTTSLYIGL